jgi:DNA repair exonuclease SbcCD nuclease subunit
MKNLTLVVTADLHFSNALPYARPLDDGRGLTDRLKDQIEVVKQIGKVARDFDADAIMVLGDIFDKRLLDAVTLRAGVSAILELSAQHEVYLLPGNHDAHTKYGGRSLVDVFSAIAPHVNGASVTVMESGEGYTFSKADGVAFHALSWAPLSEMRAELDGIKKSNSFVTARNVLLTHASVKGMRDGAWECDEGMELSELIEGFDLVLSGHFHTYQRRNYSEVSGVRTFEYVGAPMQLDFGECNNGTAVSVYTFTGTSIEHKRVAIVAPRFFSAVWERGGFQSQLVVGEGDYVRIDYPATHAEAKVTLANLQREVDALKERGVNVFTRHVPVFQHEQRLEIQEPSQHEEALGKYLDASIVEELDKVKLREVGLGLLEEARK